MEEWKEYRLGDICQTNKEQYSKKDNFNNVIYLDTGNITENTIHELQYITIGTDKLPSRARRKVNNNDIIFSNVRPIQLHYGILRNPPKNMLVSTGFTVITSNDDLCNAQFLYHFITQKEIVEHLQSIGEQAVSTYPTIKSSDIENLKICLPSLPTQQKIANILSSLDDKIEVNRRINEQLEELAQALFKSWFVDFEPFKDGEFVESELGMIPEGWKVGNLLDVATLYDSMRKPLSGRERDAMEKIYPYYGATSIMDYVDKYIFDGIYLLMGEDGSVVDDKGFPILQYVWGKFWPNNHAHVMQGKNGFTTEMLHSLLSITNVKSVVTGAVQAKISQMGMKKINIVIAPNELLEDFSMKIAPIYDKIRANSEEITHLTTLRDTLLPKLMSGEIDVDQLNVIG